MVEHWSLGSIPALAMWERWENLKTRCVLQDPELVYCMYVVVLDQVQDLPVQSDLFKLSQLYNYKVIAQGREQVKVKQ